MKLALSVSLLFVLVLFIPGETALVLAQEQPEEEPILPFEKERAALNLEAECICSRSEPGLPVATLSWAPAREPGEQQRVDITGFRDGFENRDYDVIARLSGKESTTEWSEGKSGVNYYWRVLTATDEGWITSATARVEISICPVDRRPEPDREK
jgi:hypothetical protein